MTTPDITPFCAEEDSRRYMMSRPWVKDSWRYAMDGRIVVRIPAPGEPDEPEPEAQHPRIVVMHDIFRNFAPERCREPFPAHDGRTIKVTCSNEAHYRKCHTCNETGMCQCERCDLSHECSHCEGRGGHIISKATCPECGARGFNDEIAAQIIGGKRISGPRAVLIANLPSARYWSDGDLRTTLHFTAAGGLEGVIATIANHTERETGELMEAKP